MNHLSLTPFGRQPVTAAHLENRRKAAQAPALPRIDKWDLLTQLRVARTAYGLTEREIGVLYALLSFLPARDLQDGEPMVVYPSNATLAERAHGMPESTLRRHLGTLVRAGLIARHDSPNGKRYVRRQGGEVVAAFGFDLRPLLVQAADIARAAQQAQAAVEALKIQRETLVLRLRDAAKLVAHGRDTGLPGAWDALEARLLPVRARLRRKMDGGVLRADLAEVAAVLRILVAMLDVPAEQMAGSAAQSERHHQNSNKDTSESEPCLEQAKAAGPALLPRNPESRSDPEPESGPESGPEPEAPALPLAIVLKACPDIVPYARGSLRSWRDLIGAAASVRGMMGISPSAWEEAQIHLGPVNAAIAVSAILQRFDQIGNPGGYLRALSGKAAQGGFSPGPMIMALLRKS